MSNPDSPAPYRQPRSGAGRRDAARGRGRDDPYGRSASAGDARGSRNGSPNGYAGMGAGRGGYARSDGYGEPGGNGRDDGYGRSAGDRRSGGRPDGYGRSTGYGPSNGYEPSGEYRRPDSNGSRKGHGRGGPGYDRNGAGYDRNGAGYGRDGAGYDRDGAGYGRDGAGYGRNGAAYGRNGAGYGRDRAGYGRDGAGYDRDRAGYDRDGARPGRAGKGGRRRAGGARARGSALSTELRSRLGLGNGGGYAADGYGGGAAPGYADDLDGGGHGYQEPDGFRGPGGRRAATGLFGSGTTRFTGTTGRRLARRAPVPAGGGPGDDGWDGGGPEDGWDASRRRRRKGSWWRHWTWKKALAVAAAAVAGMILLLMAVVVYAYEKTPLPTAVSEAALQQSSTVYFSDGKTEVGTFSADGIDRQMLTSSQIPAVMKNAIVAAEDRHFYTEGGISLTGILRAAYEDIKGGSSLQGGSTLTEQFAKNYYTTIGTSRSISTKVKEIFVSIKLSHEKSKDWIITQYLNTVAFGNNAYGVAAAAQVYFGEPAMKLTAAQAAMLAAMVNQPGFFSPDPADGEGYTALVERWKYVLANMVRDGALSQQQADAQKFPKVSSVNPLTAGWTGFRGYIMAAVQSELKDWYPAEYARLDTGGLKIVTTISLQRMRALYQAVDENLAKMKAGGAPLPWYAHVGAVLEQPGTGDILAMYGGPNYEAKNCARIDCQYNMATQNREQVGSSFKPYVLATAVNEGMNVSNSVLNGIEPMCIPPDTTLASRLALSQPTTNCPAPAYEVNIPGENSGHGLSVPVAAAISSDPAFEDLIHRAGTQNTIDMAKAFGVDTNLSGLQGKVHEVGLALGIASLTVEEQATTFATLANGGVYVTPHVIAQIIDNGSTVPLKIVHRRVLSPAAAADVDYALSFDVNCDSGACGTAVPNGELNPARPTIGKTGTTTNYQSAFFLGAIQQYSLAVGMFTNQQNGSTSGESLSGLPSVNGQGGGYGGAWPTTIWATFMDNEFAGLPILPLPTPDFNGFAKWVQVPKQPKKPKKHASPNPGPSPCKRRHHGIFSPCPPPSPNPTPSPFPSGSPSPTPSPTPTRKPPG